MRKQSPTIYLIIGSMLVLLTLVIVLGLLSHKHFTETLHHITKTENRDRQLFLVQDVHECVEDAEISAFMIYNLNDAVSYSDFNDHLIDCDRKINKLRDQSFQAGKMYIDSIESLVDAKFNILNELVMYRRTDVNEHIIKTLQHNLGLTRKISSLFDFIEKTQLKAVTYETEKAETAMERAKIYITIYCFLVVIFLIILIVLIFMNMNAGRRYSNAIRIAKKEAENHVKTKDIFLDNISHEIRTPMNVISGFVEQLLEGQMSEDQREKLEIIQRSSDHIIFLINDVLDFNNLQSGMLQLKRTTFEPKQIIEEVVEFLEPTAADQSTKIDVNMGHSVPNLLIGDDVRFRQILINLIGNAVKFTRHGVVRIRVEEIERNDTKTKLKLIVSDNGKGIPKDKLEQLFDEFEKADSGTTRITGGTGLGLPITKRLVDLHKGKLLLESVENKGTKITVELPYEIGSPSNGFNENPEIEKTITKAHLNILFADDEEYNRKLLATILEKHNVSFTPVSNGEMAVEAIKNNDFDLILMDIRMPIMNGFDATHLIRKMKDEEKNSIPIIALTAAVSESDTKMITDSGMNSFIAKPFSERRLIQAINSVISPEFSLYCNETETDNNQETNLTQKHMNVLDFTELKNISDGDMVFYQDMLKTFLNETSENLEKMEEVFEAKNWVKLADLAHKICAPCLHLGAKDLHAKLKAIEHKGRDGDIKGIEKLFEETKNTLLQAFSEVEKELKGFKY